MASATSNPFDLDKKKKGGLPDKVYKAKTYTEEDKAVLLHGYIDLPEDLWEFVKYGTHVRYITKAGEFRTGGFVVQNPIDIKPKEKEPAKRYIKMQNGFSGKTFGHTEWMANYADLGHLYAKPDALDLTFQRMLEGAVKGLNDNIKKLAIHSKKLEERIAALEHR